jgi:dTDP-glucose 4,6-dehydratase
MVVLVIGGAGFIGSSLVRELSKEEEVVVYDLLTYAGRTENLQGVKHVLVKGDVASRELHDVVEKYSPNTVINLAAETHVDRSIYSPENFVRTNVLGALNVLEASRRFGFRYVHVSTDEVYGEECADEQAPLNPSSPYSASKASADLLVKAYVRTYSLDAFIVRPSNNYGPRQYPEKMIPKAVIRTLLGMSVPVYGDGKQERDWIYVEDTAKVISTLAREGRKGEVYNLPGNNVVNNLELLRTLGEVMGVEIRLKFVNDRPGHDRRYCMRNTKLNYHVTPLREGLERTVRWYRENRWWWEPLIKDRFFLEDEPWREGR